MNKSLTREVRVRFAPSPTGALHLGGIRTALYNFLFARKHKGKFILRIEDTDQKRYVPGAEEYIFSSLKWLGLERDEDPLKGGPAKTYRQSERNTIYQDKIKTLIDNGSAYYAFDTSQDLEAMRERLLAAKIPSPKYNTVSREFMKNSLVLSKDEVEKLIELGTPYVIRLKTPHNRAVRFFDEVRGWVKVDYTEIEDKVLIKSDGIPTYHFANVVDDYMMNISHVIRGEEWLSSTPVHVLLYEAFGWESVMPKFVHLPLILKPDGQGKLSKRDTDQLGFPIFPLNWTSATGEFSQGLKESGYLPQAILNFLALMGWNPGTEQEVFTLDELIEQFSLERIGKSGAKFNIEKAKWFNAQHLSIFSKAHSEKFLEQVETRLVAKKLIVKKEKLSNIIDKVVERNSFLDEVVEEIILYMKNPCYDISSRTISEGIILVLKEFLNLLKTNEEMTNISFKEKLEKIVAPFELKLGSIMPIIRYAISGQKKGIDLLLLVNFLGQSECFNRIEKFINNVK